MKLMLKTGLLAAIAFAMVGSTARADVFNGTLPANACEAGKAKCVTKMGSCLLGCYDKAVGGGAAPDPACVAKCRNGFLSDSNPGPTTGKGCVEKLEAKGGCGASAGDGPVLKSKVEARAADIYRALDPSLGSLANKCTAGKMKCVIKYDACVLGIAGKALKAGGAIGDTSKCKAILVGPKSCIAKLELKNPVGSATQCSSYGDAGSFQTGGDAYVSDILFDFVSGPHNMKTRRCLSATNTTCTSDADCSGGAGDCQYFFGSELPLAAGGVTSCVVTHWSGGISGTFDQASGQSSGTAHVISQIYLGVGSAEPCPRCVGGNGIPNDGLGLGTCSAGPRFGLACDENGLSPVPAFGYTSLDCPPTPGALVATLPVDLSNTNNGTVTKTLSASSPSCNGEPGHKCMCSSCSLNSSIPCFTDADCAAASAGTCTNNAGTPRETSACVDDTTTPADESLCTTLPGGGGTCVAGPIDQHCTIESFRGCTTDTDCPALGDTCTSSNRRCYAGYKGAVGDTITAAAAHSAPQSHTNSSTFASIFCVAPTSSSAINNAAGLPGPGTLQLAGVSTENGTSGSCPTTADFLPTATGGVLSSGWTGLAHSAPAVGQGKVTVSATCAGAPGACSCTYNGPIANP